MVSVVALSADEIAGLAAVGVPGAANPVLGSTTYMTGRPAVHRFADERA